ncbi:helix-turn-helix transcriptional regulator [Tianweitania sp.]|uniref:helix-turn-helix domain-containing protein n=1 Tax=Tianweitania sp. TaxID=2021634 RepID=UPI0028962CD9|nr:helix-turn-helix transcriptional regulator [Tianweitania sp.]
MTVIRAFPSRTVDTDTLGGRLSRTRDASGISLQTLARRVGVKKQTIIDWENDRSEPNVERLTLVASVLDVTLMWLMHGVGDAPADEIGPDPLASMTAQIERLRRIHEDTGQIIERLGREIERLHRGE